MGHLHRARPDGTDDLHQAPALQRFEVRRIGEPLDGFERHLLADRDHLQRLAPRRLQEPEPLLHQLLQPFPRTLGRQQDPAAAAAVPPLDRGGDQLADEQGVAPAEPPDPVLERCRDAPVPLPGAVRGGLGVAVQRATDHRQDQLLGRVAGQGSDVEAHQQLVLPQPDEARRQWLRGPDAHQHLHVRLGDGEVQQRHRRLVQQVRVVDCEHQAGVAGPLAEAGERQVEQVVRELGIVDRRQEVGEGPERDVPGRLGGPHPLDRHPVGPPGVDDLRDEARLAHSRIPEQRDAARPPAGTQQPLQIRQLVHSPNQRPTCDHEHKCYPAGPHTNTYVLRIRGPPATRSVASTAALGPGT